MFRLFVFRIPAMNGRCLADVSPIPSAIDEGELAKMVAFREIGWGSDGAVARAGES